MSTVTYVGNFEPEWSTENDVRRAFEELGYEVTCLQENKTNVRTIQAAASQSDLLLWTGTWDDLFSLDEVRDVTHDLAKAGVPSACYHLDTFWETSRGGRRWWRHPMFAMGHVFTADGDSERRWEDMGVRHRWLRPGVRHDACYVGEAREEYACDVALVGSNGKGYHEDVWPYRRDLVLALEEMCDRRGWGWRNPGGEPDKPDNGKVPRDGRMNDFYASAKVTVGDSLCPLKDDSLYWSDRAYEAPGRGGLLVMPQINELLHDYEGNMAMYPWDDFGALERVVEFLLDDEGYRAKLREANHEVAKRDHTYVNRVEEILEVVIP